MCFIHHLGQPSFSRVFVCELVLFFDGCLLKYFKRAFAFQAFGWHIFSRSISQTYTRTHTLSFFSSLFLLHQVSNGQEKFSAERKKNICNIIQINDDDDNDDDDLSSSIHCFTVNRNNE